MERPATAFQEIEHLRGRPEVSRFRALTFHSARDATRTAAAILLILTVAGCAEWHRPNTSDSMLLMDQAECRETARVWETLSTGERPTWKIDNNRFDGCMTERGYTKSWW